LLQIEGLRIYDEQAYHLRQSPAVGFVKADWQPPSGLKPQPSTYLTLVETLLAISRLL
jgi:hypothetical protein